MVFQGRLDSDKIDIDATLLNNKVVLVNPYTRAFKAETLDERALIFYIKLFLKSDEFLLDINSFIFFIFVPYVALAYLAKKLLKAFKDNEEDSTLERALVGCFYSLSVFTLHTPQIKSAERIFKLRTVSLYKRA
ncbi:MAG: hypothetical protein LRY68_10035 [Sulfurospirillum sp.]|nr:hypothetical protein [Sulfurospirillum sp.]